MNFKLLKQKNPLLYNLVVSHNEMRAEAVQCQNEQWTLKLETMDNKRIFTHSKYDPNRDIQKNISKVDLNAKMIICFGLGLGYEVKHIVTHKLKSAKVIVIEPRLDVLEIALGHNHTTEILSSPDVFLFGGDLAQIKAQIQYNYRQIAIYTSVKPELVFVPYWERIYDQYLFSGVLRELRSSVIDFVMRIGNSVEDTLLGINHFFSNIIHTFNSPLLATLGDTYKGFPAICVASGPSLDKNIDELYRVKDRALIFCADSIYEKLLDYGIVADAVSVLERTKNVYNLFFKNKNHLFNLETVLLSQIVAYPKILNEYPGMKVICGKEAVPFERLAGEHIPTLNTFRNGLSCAHLSFATARLLGCDPIILVGQDLAYGREGFTHAKGTYGENWTAEDDSREGIMTLNRKVQAWDKKGEVITTAIWESFRRWFEEEIIREPHYTYINATEGGAHIEGTETLTLKKTGSQFLNHTKQKIPLKTSILQNQVNYSKEELQRCTLEYFNRECDDLKRIKERVCSAKKILNKLSKKLKKAKVKEKLFTRENCESLIQCINELERSYLDSPTFSFISQSMQAVFRQMIHQNSHIEDVKTMEYLTVKMLSKAKELEATIEKVMHEYERGLDIINSGRVETIETPLLGEMYQE